MTKDVNDELEIIQPKQVVYEKFSPDLATLERISNLAVVGTALMERANDNVYQTEFMLAKQALHRFMKGVERLDLDPESMKGMQNLVHYLEAKIDKRLKSNVEMTPLE